jgi:hypothetical protein
MYWIADPVLFCREVLGIGLCDCNPKCEIDAIQASILRDWARLILVKRKAGNKNVLDTTEQEINKKIGISVQSGKGIGKTFLAAVVAIWFFVCFEDARVILMGPDFTVIKTRLWAEISKWLAHAERVFGESSLVSILMDKQSEKIYMKGLSKMGEKDRWVIHIQNFPKNTDIESQKIAVQGQHDKNMLFLIDEGTGVPDHIFEAILDTCIDPVGINSVFSIFNPNRTNGWCIRSQEEDKFMWICHRINSENSPRVSPVAIQRLETKYGRDSNQYRVAVLGLKPTSEKGALIPWEWIDAAKDRAKDYEPDKDDPVIFGIDIGGGGMGDISTICIRKGWHILGFLVNNSTKTDLIAKWIMDAMDEWEPQQSYMDSNGIGHVPYKQLLTAGYKVVGINSMDSSTVKDIHFRMRDELMDNMKEGFEKDLFVIHPYNAKHIVSNPLSNEETMFKTTFDDDFAGELSLLKVDDGERLDGKLKMMSKTNSTYKKEMRALLGYESPNKADALSLTCYHSTKSYFKQQGKSTMRKKVMEKRRQTKADNPNRWMAVRSFSEAFVFDDYSLVA